MHTFVLAVHIIVAIAMTGLILIQHGKGADAGASFGAGGAGTVFGAAGSANFLTRTTAVLTAIFFTTSMVLAIDAREQSSDQYRLDIADTAPAALETLDITDADSSQAPASTSASTSTLSDDSATTGNAETESASTESESVPSSE